MSVTFQVVAALEIDSIEEPTTKSVVAAAASPMTNGETVLVNGGNDEGSCCSEEQATANGIDVNVVTTNVAVKKSAISATTR